MIDLKALRNVGNLHEFAVLFGFDWDDPDWDWTWHDVAVKMADDIEAWNTCIEPLDYIECYECQNGAPMVPLRTCHLIDCGFLEDNADDGVSLFECDACGGLFLATNEGKAEHKYCCYCGAKVVEE